MLVTNHVLQGALLGRVVRRPAGALVLGVASHFAADALPHWGDIGVGVRAPEFLRVAVPDGLTGLLTMAVVLRCTPVALRPPVLAGMVGAALPDLDKPWALVTDGRAIWPAAVTRFHSRIQREAPDRLPWEVALAGALALLYAAASRSWPRPPGAATVPAHG